MSTDREDLVTDEVWAAILAIRAEPVLLTDAEQELRIERLAKEERERKKERERLEKQYRRLQEGRKAALEDLQPSEANRFDVYMYCNPEFPRINIWKAKVCSVGPVQFAVSVLIGGAMPQTTILDFRSELVPGFMSRSRAEAALCKMVKEMKKAGYEECDPIGPRECAKCKDLMIQIVTPSEIKLCSVCGAPAQQGAELGPARQSEVILTQRMTGQGWDRYFFNTRGGRRVKWFIRILETEGGFNVQELLELKKLKRVTGPYSSRSRAEGIVSGKIEAKLKEGFLEYRSAGAVFNCPTCKAETAMLEHPFGPTFCCMCGTQA